MSRGVGARVTPALVVDVRGVGTVAANDAEDLLGTLRVKAFWGEGLGDEEFCRRYAEGEGLAWPTNGGSPAERLLGVLQRGGAAVQRGFAPVVRLFPRPRG